MGTVASWACSPTRIVIEAMTPKIEKRIRGFLEGFMTAFAMGIWIVLAGPDYQWEAVLGVGVLIIGATIVEVWRHG